MKIKIIKNTDIKDFQNWSIWTCPPSTFDWRYETEEHCYIVEGEVTVQNYGNTVDIVAGDYVIFPKGLDCLKEISVAAKIMADVY